MLINKTEHVVSAKYNEKTIETAPGAVLDVRDFGVTGDQTLQVENHIIKKNPGCFTQENNPQVAATTKAPEAQIRSLQNYLNKATVQIGDLVKENQKLQEKVRSLNNDNDGYDIKIKGLKDQLSELKAKLKAKDMPDK